MHAKKSQQPLQPRSGAIDRPLATSAFKGQARLRELEHLAETARKVRDQAASELTRGGATHHIARDRIGAAERMLQKTQQEIAELRAHLGPTPDPAAAPKPKDFELAMMLGHNKATFNRDEAGQLAYEIQQDAPARSAKKTTSGKPAARAGKHTRSAWRTLTFAMLISIGAGLGAIGTYALATTGSLTEASQVVHDGAFQLVNKLRALMPTLSLPAGTTSTPANANTIAISEATAPSVTEARSVSAQQLQEQQARAAAEQRLARQIASPEKPRR